MREQVETFLRRARERDRPLPRFVERELRGYLECGILAHGFVRVRCDACGCDRLVALSCKGRGFCRSCGGRRMADTAAHLVDRVLPEVAIRQWVLSVPFALRYRLAYDARLTSDVLGLFVRAVFASLRRRARSRWGARRGQCGAVTKCQVQATSYSQSALAGELVPGEAQVEEARGRPRLLGVATTRAGIAFALAALTLAVFVQVRHHDFVDYDDYILVTKQPEVRAGLSREGVAWAFTSFQGWNWFPLTRLSWMLDAELFGLDPGAFHATSLALHVANVLLLFLALLRLSGDLWPSVFVAGVFALHPLHVESVAWVSTRRDVLSGTFFMLALLAHERCARSDRRRAWCAVLFALLALGLMAKPMLVTLPCVLLLLDYWPLGRLRRKEDLRGALVEKLPLFALAALACGITLVAQRTGGALKSLEIYPLDARLLNAVDSYLVYITKSFWPSGLAVFYPHPLGTLPVARVVAEGILLLALTGAVVALRRSRPYLLVGWLWYVGMLVPVIGLVQVGLQARADRYMYLPLIGLSIALAWGAADLARGRLTRRVLALGGAGAVAALAVVAWVQVGYWRDSMTLFERNLAVTQENVYAHMLVARQYLRAERFEQAEYHYTRVFELVPEEGRSRLVRLNIVMGDRLAKRQELDAALARYQEAVRIDPKHGRANGLLGQTLVVLNRALEARPSLEIALREQPGNSQLHAAMAAVAAAEGKLAEAVEHNREALRIEPTLRSARNNLAWLLATSPDASLRDPVEALRLAEGLRDEAQEPSANLLDTLAAAYAAAGRFEEAIRSAEQAVALAEAEGSLTLAQTFRERISGYRSRKPYTAAYPSADASSGLPSRDP